MPPWSDDTISGFSLLLNNKMWLMIAIHQDAWGLSNKGCTDRGSFWLPPASVLSRVGDDQHSGDNAKIGHHESNTVELGIRKTETPWRDKA